MSTGDGSEMVLDRERPDLRLQRGEANKISPHLGRQEAW